MKITILGSGTLQPTSERNCPGYLVQLNNTNILFDSGSGTLKQLANIGLNAKDIDFIFYSHLHPDHCGDLIPILFAKIHTECSPRKRLTIKGPPGFLDFYENLNKAFSRWINIENEYLDLSEYEQDTTEFDQFSIKILPVQHSNNSYGFKLIFKEKSITYSGDTEYCENLVILCKNTNAAIIECAHNDRDKVIGHMTPSEILKVILESEVKRVILTHFYQNADNINILDNFRDIKDTVVERAQDLKIIQL